MRSLSVPLRRAKSASQKQCGWPSSWKSRRSDAQTAPAMRYKRSRRDARYSYLCVYVFRETAVEGHLVLGRQGAGELLHLGFRERLERPGHFHVLFDENERGHPDDRERDKQRER